MMIIQNILNIVKIILEISRYDCNVLNIFTLYLYWSEKFTRLWKYIATQCCTAAGPAFATLAQY